MERLEFVSNTSSEWTRLNPLLEDGELGQENDTRRFKLGNGISRWNDLQYLIGKQVPQEVEYSANILLNYLTGEDAIITLEGDISELKLSNVPQQGTGDITLVQNSTGGFGVLSIVHDGLVVKYVAGQAPTAANINSSAEGHSVISYKRIGNLIYLSYADF